MNVTSKISVDLTRQNVGQRVNAVQGDGNTRLVEITLLCGGAPWTPPDGVEAAIAYMQPSGTKGMYNLLADGTASISITGNVATAILAPQMLTVSGTVQASLVFNDQRLNRLTTFPFAVSVASNPAAVAQKTEDYIRLQWLEDKLDEYLRKAADSGEFDGKDGDPGAPGADGYSPTASVMQTDTGAVITITDKTGTATATLKNGSDGKPGKTGATPNIQIGTVETLAAGSSATASMGGTPENPLLNLGIPQGAPGSGGSGIAVTGATVGQTVKIAAVDDNGVPTAWEAVDLPDPGGNVDQSDSVFKGKTASFYGDSLTEVNGHYTKGYHSWVKDLLGLASYNNYGVGGYKVSDVYDKVNSVTDTADIIFVMCGVNDQNFSVPLGTMGDNTTGTTYGALNLLCALLKQKYPTSIVVFITPHYQTKYPHSSGITSYEVSKAIREVCEKYAIPVYDNFVLSGIYSTNLSTFTTDNCHWNDIAHEMVGKNLAKFVTDSFRYVYDDESIVDVAMSDVGVLANRSYLNTGKTATYDGWETYSNKLEVSGYSSITGRFCCHYLPFVANVPYIVFFGKEDEVVGWEGLSINVGESEKEDEKGGYGYSIERTFAIPDGAVTAALNGTTPFFDAYNNSGTYRLRRAK